MERQKLVALVTAAQSGDRGAMDDLFTSFYDDVYYFALKTVKDQDLACDITQETFVAIVGNLHTLQEPAAFVTWMKQIAFSQCTRYFRKKKEVLVEENEDGQTVFDIVAEDRTEFIPDEAVDQEDFRNTILSMVDRLSEEQRAAVMLYYYDELSVKEIAQIQGVTEGTVKSRLNYGRKAIRAAVEDYEKQNNVRLHSVALLPMLYWLFAGTRQKMPAAAVRQVSAAVAGACSTAAGTGAAAVATGAAAKTVGSGLAVKIVAGIAAASLVAGGIGIGVSRSRDVPSRPKETTAQSSTVPPTEAPLVAEGTVPEGFRYIAADGTQRQAGEAMPAVQDGDELVTEGYTYKYNYSGSEWGQMYHVFLDGWGLRVDDRTQVTYPALYSSINGAPLVDMTYAFTQCQAMTQAPRIPATVRNMDGCFVGCVALETAPRLPEGVENVDWLFSGCTSLVEAPQIPVGVIDITGMFDGCSALRTVPPLPEGIITMNQTFHQCTSLQQAPLVPEGVEHLKETFKGCTALVNAPAIPSSAQNIHGMFSGCAALEVPPVIPEGIRDMGWLLADCVSLKMPPVIPEGMENMFAAFNGCRMLEQAPVLPDSVTDIGHCFGGCESLVDPPVLPKGLKSMSYAFFDCKSLKTRPEIPDSVENQYGAFWGCDQLPEE